MWAVVGLKGELVWVPRCSSRSVAYDGFLAPSERVPVQWVLLVTVETGFAVFGDEGVGDHVARRGWGSGSQSGETSVFFHSVVLSFVGQGKRPLPNKI